VNDAIRNNLRAQTAVAPQELFRAWFEGAIHPVTGLAFGRAVETNTFDLEFFSNQFIQIGMARQDIASHERGGEKTKVLRLTESLENLEFEKRDLPFVVGLVIEEAIAPDPMPRHALNGWNFLGGKIVRVTTVMTKEIVPSGNVKMTNFHWTMISSPGQTSSTA
jgi:hypothetical protein